MFRNVYNKVRSTYGEMLPYTTLDSTKPYYLFHNWIDLPFELEKETFNVKSAFAHMKNHKEETYVACIKENIRLEPVWGWALVKGKLVLESVPGNNWNVKHKWHFHPAPNRFDYTFKFWKKNYLNEVIYLNYYYNFAKNYYHFFIDLFGQLMLMENAGVDMNLPVIVHKRIWETKFFQDALRLSVKFSKFNWVVLGEEIICVRKMWVGKNVSFQANLSEYIRSYFQIPKDMPNKRIYLSRKKGAERSLLNDDWFSEILKEKGFERIDSADYNLSNQIQLFSELTDIVAIHGAGLTNIIWQNKIQMKITEIFPSDYVFHHYWLLSKAQKFNYTPCVLKSSLEKLHLTEGDLRKMSL